MIKRLLIANRGEIACRIIKTAKQLGIHCVAIYSDEDRHAQHVKLADEAYHVGPAASAQSYLVIDKIISIAKKSQVDAIHPGYGFLSENANFANACQENAIIFVGPPAPAIESMGSKSAAKTLMEKANVPILPGYHGDDQTESLLHAEAEKIGFPVLIKATAGGGGKGMRIVNDSTEFLSALEAAKRESKKSFNDDQVLIEKFLQSPRHIEIQIVADQLGQCVYLFERDCSIQRRQQKIVEEAPAPHFNPSLRKKMGEAVIAAANAIGYVGAGTIEFLVWDDQFYFMEMNTRLQVEHPVTEFITGVDLVEWQLKIAGGEPLPLSQDQLDINGHAIEVRIYAEDPEHHFLPSTGKIEFLQEPVTGQYVRLDTGIQQGDSVSLHYDPMIAKLIVWGQSRETSVMQLTNALKSYLISGIKTNIPYLQKLIQEPDFLSGHLDTHFIDDHPVSLSLTEFEIIYGLLIVCLYIQTSTDNQNAISSPWSTLKNWRLNSHAIRMIELRHNDALHQVMIESHAGFYLMHYQDKSYQVSGNQAGQQWKLIIDGHQFNATITAKANSYSIFCDTFWMELHAISHQQPLEDMNQGSLLAPMHGTVIHVMVENQQMVEKNQALLILEAMKMEHTIVAPHTGKIIKTFFKPGEVVNEGAELIEIEPIDD